MTILRALLAPFRPSAFPPPPWTLEQVDGPVPVFPPGAVDAFVAQLREIMAAKAAKS